MLVRGYLYPQPLLHNDLNAPTCPEYSTNIPARRSFYRLECTRCLLYPIRARDAIPKVLCNIRIGAGPSEALLILWGVPEASGLRSDLRASRTFGFIRKPSAASLDLRSHHSTFGRKGDLRALVTFCTFDFHPAV